MVDTKKQETLPLSKVKIDNDIQSRAVMDRNILSDYIAAMREGAQFPPIIVFYDGEFYWLADGFHRTAAAKHIGLESLEAEVHAGSRRDAVLFSVGANANHGLRRTNEDKKKSVLRLLSDQEWKQWSDRQIAEKCAVSHTFVANMRRELSGNGCQIESKKVERAGTVYSQRKRRSTESAKPKAEYLKQASPTGNIEHEASVKKERRIIDVSDKESYLCLLRELQEKEVFSAEHHVLEVVFGKLIALKDHPDRDQFIPSLVKNILTLADIVIVGELE